MSSNQRLVFSILEFLNSECESRMEDERESLEGTCYTHYCTSCAALTINYKPRVLATVKNSALNAVFPITLRSQVPNLGQPKNSYRNSMLLIRH
jgi:hypothetical protein